MNAFNIPQKLIDTAFGGTSYTPEARGQRAVDAYAAELAQDLERLRQHAEIGGTLDLLESESARYRAGYGKHLAAWLASESRCVSSMIAGPANFPARRMEKRNAIARKRAIEFTAYRGRALKAAARNLRPDLRPIMSGDADAVQRLQAEIDAAEAAHARMKEANLAIRKHAKAGAEAQVAALVDLGFAADQAAQLLRPDFCGRIGFADYALTNSNARIRNMRQRLEALREAKAAPVVERESAAGVRLEDDPPANRVRLIFPDKPDAETRARLKGGGFRWAPSAGAWQGYRNPRTLALAQQIAA